MSKHNGILNEYSIIRKLWKENKQIGNLKYEFERRFGFNDIEDENFIGGPNKILIAFGSVLKLKPTSEIELISIIEEASIKNTKNHWIKRLIMSLNSKEARTRSQKLDSLIQGKT